MIKSISLFLILFSGLHMLAQTWVTTEFEITSQLDVPYGSARNFAGQVDTLLMDISYPLNDSSPDCGRPLLIIVHGGGWMDGSKNDPSPVRLREEFASRGYVTAAVNYRLGMYYTDRFLNCNAPGWNCLNMTDSSEWYRANYRATQDVHGAVRYLVDSAANYQLNPDNVFLVGESAGGFVAMSVAFLDSEEEVLAELVGDYPDAPQPHTHYDNCLIDFGLPYQPEEVDLSRPALGPYTGTIHAESTSLYTIRSVGNIYGGAFNNIFQHFQGEGPSLYLYHQPCDLVVPFTSGRAFGGLVNCLTGFPFNCGYPINRPLVYGSNGIKVFIDTLVADGQPAPEYMSDFSNNNYGCVEQVVNNNACHAFDNFELRTLNMATFFAEYVEACTSVVVREGTEGLKLQVYPNPTGGNILLDVEGVRGEAVVRLYNMQGKVMRNWSFNQLSTTELELDAIPAGLYLLIVSSASRQWVKRVIIR